MWTAPPGMPPRSLREGLNHRKQKNSLDKQKFGKSVKRPVPSFETAWNVVIVVFFRGIFSTKFWFNRTSKISAVEGVSCGKYNSLKIRLILFKFCEFYFHTAVNFPQPCFEKALWKRIFSCLSVSSKSPSKSIRYCRLQRRCAERRGMKERVRVRMEVFAVDKT